MRGVCTDICWVERYRLVEKNDQILSCTDLDPVSLSTQRMNLLRRHITDNSDDESFGTSSDVIRGPGQPQKDLFGALFRALKVVFPYDPSEAVVID